MDVASGGATTGVVGCGSMRRQWGKFSGKQTCTERDGLIRQCVRGDEQVG